MQERREFKPQDWTAEATVGDGGNPSQRPARRFLIVGCALIAGLAGVYFGGRLLTQGAGESPEVLPDAPTEATEETLGEEALRVATLLVQRFPNSPDSLNVMGWTRHSFGDSPAAMRCWQESLRLNPLSGVPYFCMGRVAAEHGEHGKAAELFRKSLRLDPRSVDAQTRLAEALMELGRAEEVIELLDGGQAADLGSPEHLFVLGQAYLQLEQHGKAEEKLKAFVKLAPTDRDAFYLLATAYGKLGQKEKAAQYVEKVKKLYDRERKGRQARHGLRGDAARGILASIYLLAGQVYYDRRMLPQAEAHWQQGIAADPADTKARRALAELYQTQGRFAETIKMMEEIRQIEPENVFHRLDTAALYARLGQVDAAEAALKETVEQVPDWPMGYVALVQLYLESNRKLDQAAALVHTAVELEPIASNYFLLSSVARRRGDSQEALAAVERALELDPGNRGYQRAHEQIRGKL